MALLATGTFADSYGGIGDHSSDDLAMAIDLAEFDIADALDTFLEPTTVTGEEHMWPYGNGGRLMLDHMQVTSITSVVAKHSLDADCVWVEDTECGVILDGETGLIMVRSNNLSLSADCNCSSGVVPDRAKITYVAGYTIAEAAFTTSLGKALRMAIALRAREWLAALEQNDFWEGEFLIKGFGSMDYNEQREFMERKLNPLGPGAFSQTAWRILKRIKPYRAIMIRGTGRI